MNKKNIASPNGKLLSEELCASAAAIHKKHDVTKNTRTKESTHENDYEKKFKKYQLWFPFLILPCYLLLCFCVVIQEMFLTFFKTMSDGVILLFVLSFFGLFLICCFFLFRKYLAAGAEYRQLAKLWELQQSRYTKVMEKRMELERLREELVKRLGEVVALLEAKDYSAALTQLDHLTSRIRKTSEYPFCSNAVINSVLTETKHCCEKHSVDFCAELFIGACSVVSDLHFCSIFSNLLDNALHACLALPEGVHRRIVVTARQDMDYLHIKVVNTAPAIPTEPANREKHGYGQKILRDIAKKYGGDFQVNYMDGTYEAFLSLYIPENAPFMEQNKENKPPATGGSKD